MESDSFTLELKNVYAILRDKSKIQNKDFSNKEKSQIRKLIKGVGKKKLKSFANEKGIQITGDWNIPIFAQIAKALDFEEFKKFVNDCAAVFSKMPTSLTFESYGTVGEVSDWSIMRDALQTEFRKNSSFSHLTEPVTVSEKDYPAQGYTDYIFRYPTDACVMEWKHDELDYEKPVSVRVRINKNTHELSIGSAGKRRDGFDDVIAAIKKVMDAKKVDVAQPKKEETKNNILSTTLGIKQAVFLHAEKDQKIKLTLEGADALKFLKEVLGDKYQKLLEKFEIIGAVDNDGKKQL